MCALSPLCDRFDVPTFDVEKFQIHRKLKERIPLSWPVVKVLPCLSSSSVGILLLLNHLRVSWCHQGASS